MDDALREAKRTAKGKPLDHRLSKIKEAFYKNAKSSEKKTQPSSSKIEVNSSQIANLIGSFQSEAEKLYNNHRDEIDKKVGKVPMYKPLSYEIAEQYFPTKFTNPPLYEPENLELASKLMNGAHILHSSDISSY